MDEALQPLRVPAGWHLHWNTLVERDPTAENVERGLFGGSMLLWAVHEHRRFSLAVKWRPENDPTGSYQLRVAYVPWDRTDDGRRRKDVPIDFRKAEIVHEFETRTRPELVRELESWLVKCVDWVREGS